MPFSLTRRVALLVLLVASMLAVTPMLQARAQSATPSTTQPIPCTGLFGIEDPETGCLLIIHAAPDAGPVDVYLDGEVAITGAEFGILGDFLPVPAGAHQVQVTAAGGDPADAVIDAEMTVEPGVAYEVAAVGLGGEYQLVQAIVDTTPVAPDEARVRVVHAGPDAPAVDVAVTGGDVLISDLAYLQSSDVLTVPAGTYDLEVRPTGTADVAFALPGTVLEGGYTYSVFAIGLVADGTFGAIIVPIQLLSAAEAAQLATPVS